MGFTQVTGFRVSTFRILLSVSPDVELAWWAEQLVQVGGLKHDRYLASLYIIVILINYQNKITVMVM